MTVIELGDVGGEPPAESERAPEFRRGSVRRMVLAGLALLCAVTVGGSARPEPPLIRPLWSVPFTENDGLSIRGDLIITQIYQDGPPRVTAHDARTGEVRWSRPLPEGSAGMDTSLEAGVILVAVGQETTTTDYGDGSMGLSTHGGTITAVDPDTGATLWNQPGSLHLAAGPETVLLAVHGQPDEPGTLRLVRLRDGGTVWERTEFTGLGQTSVQFEGDVPALVLNAAENGEITVLDYATGALRLARKLPWTARQPDSGAGTSTMVAGDLLLVNRATGTAGTITAYRLDTLERLWSAGSTTNVWALTCGPVICLTEENTVRAVDPVTGAPRWTGTGWPVTGLVPGDELLLIGRSETDARLALIEAATGKTRGEPGRGWVAYSDSAEGIVVLLDPPVQDGTRSVVTRMDLTTGRSLLLGTVELGGAGQCVGTGRILACPSASRLVVNAIS